MTQSAVQARREYQRAWRQKNPDKVKANNARYWERKAKAAESDQERQKAEKSGGQNK